MPAFHYTAIDAIGKENKGVIEAENEKHARQLLRNKALVPLRIKATQEKKNRSTILSSLSRARGLNSKELSLFTRQFATLIAAALPIEECLQAVAEQTEKSRIKGLILSVRSKVVEINMKGWLSWTASLYSN